MSVVVSGDFCCFKLGLPSLLFLSKAIFYDLRSLHPGTCLDTKTPYAFRWKRAFSTRISKFASFWLCYEQANGTRPRKELGHEVNFLSTASGIVDQRKILTPFPQRHLALIHYPDQIPDSDVKLAKSYDT